MQIANKKRRYSQRDKELLDFARVYLSEAFPNPARTGCPSDEALKSLAKCPSERAVWITDHVTHCSPCFNAYVAHLQKETKKATESQALRLRKGITLSLSFGTIAGILLIAYAFIGKAHIWHREIRAAEPNAHGPIVRTQPPSSTRYAQVVVDLSNSSPPRGNQWKKRSAQSIPSDAIINLNFALPLGSEAKLYTVNLSSSRKVVWSGSAKAQMNDGQVNVAMIADLRSLPTGNYDLTITSEGLHITVPVILTSSPGRSP